MIFTADIEIKTQNKLERKLVLERLRRETNLTWQSGHELTKFTPEHNDMLYIGFDHVTCGSKEFLRKKQIQAKQLL